MRQAMRRGPWRNGHAFPAVLMGLALLLGTARAGATCGEITTDYPLVGLRKIKVESGVTMNGNPVTDQVCYDAVDGAGGFFQLDPLPAFPALDPVGFPTVAFGSTVSTGPTVAAGTYKAVTPPSGAVTTFTGGEYYIETLDIAGDATVELAPGDYFIETLKLSDDATVTVNPAGPVNLYVASKLDAGGPKRVSLNAGGDASLLRIYLYSTEDVRLGEDFTVNAVLYAPYMDVKKQLEVGQRSALTGAFTVTGEVRVKQDVALAYDAATQAAVAAVSTCRGVPGGAGCGALVADYGLVGLGKLKLETGVTMDGAPLPAYQCGGGALDHDGSLADLSPYPVLPPIEPATFPVFPDGPNLNGPVIPAGTYKDVKPPGGSVTVFTGGQYFIRKLEPSSGAAVQLAPGEYFIEQLKLHNNDVVVTVSPPGIVRLYIEGKGDMGDRNTLNQGGDPAHLQLFVYGDKKVDVGKDTVASALIYAPHNKEKVEIRERTVFTGLIVTAGEVKLKDDAQLFSVPSLNYLSSCSAIVDHFHISHSGLGLTCEAEPVTITAHNADHNAVGLTAASTIALSTSTLHGDWSLAGGGSLTNAGLGVGTFTFDGQASAQLLLKNSHLETLDIDVAMGLVTERSGTASGDVPFDPPLTFAETGFRLVDDAGVAVIGTRLAGLDSDTGADAQSLYLEAVRSSDESASCDGVLGGETVDVELAFQCLDPGTCAGRQVSVNGTDIAANPASGVSSYTTVSLSFTDDGTVRAPTVINYPDVGRIQLHARYDIPLEDGSPSGNYMSGTSNPFVVKPFDLEISAVQRTADAFANPAAAGAGGAAFIAAGASFSATVTATTQAGTAAPNFGQESTPEGVRLDATLVAPVGGNLPALSNATGFGAFSAGVATGTAFSWGEVGIIELTAAIADGDYLGAGDLTGTPSGNVGRFHPDHYTVGDVVLTERSDLPGCLDAFSYMGEPFGLDFSLTARNVAGVTTQNYQGDFAKLAIDRDPPFGAGDLGFGAGNSPGAGATALTGRLQQQAVAGAFSTGRADISTTLALLRPGAGNDGPFQDLRLGLSPGDADGVTVQAPDLDPALTGSATHAQLALTDVRLGRLRLENAYGSELEALTLAVRAEHFDGNGFVTNLADACTPYTAGSLVLSNYTDSLQAGESTASGAGSLSAGVHDPANPLVLSAPGAGNDGSVDIAHTAAGWLRYDWDGDGSAEDPWARLTFGIFQGADALIYRREVY